MYGMRLCKIVMLVRRAIHMVSLNDDYLNGRNLMSLFDISANVATVIIICGSSASINQVLC